MLRIIFLILIGFLVYNNLDFFNDKIDLFFLVSKNNPSLIMSFSIIFFLSFVFIIGLMIKGYFELEKSQDIRSFSLVIYGLPPLLFVLFLILVSASDSLNKSVLLDDDARTLYAKKIDQEIIESKSNLNYFLDNNIFKNNIDKVTALQLIQNSFESCMNQQKEAQLPKEQSNDSLNQFLLLMKNNCKAFAFKNSFKK